jgi:hypothetical protein
MESVAHINPSVRLKFAGHDRAGVVVVARPGMEKELEIED